LTQRRKPAATPPTKTDFLNPDSLRVGGEFFVDSAEDVHDVGVLGIDVTGQRIAFDGPDGAAFDGTLAEFCSLLRSAAEYRNAERVLAEAENERRFFAEMRAEYAQLATNLKWRFGDGTCPTCAFREDRKVVAVTPRLRIMKSEE